MRPFRCDVRLAALLCLAAGAVAGGPAAERPALTAHDVRNAANYSAGGVAPGEVVVLFPSDAGPLEMVPWGLAGNLAETRFLGETRVLFDGAPTPIIYTVRGRICTVVPDSVAGKESTELIVEYEGRRSPPVTLPVVASSPAIFTLDSTGQGQAAMLNETGCCNSVRNPAVLGTAVSLYATGEGILAQGSPEHDLSVTVGGRPAPITFVQRDAALQVNFRIPADAPVGDAIPLVLTVHGKASTPGVTMALRAPQHRVLLAHPDVAVREELTQMLESAGYRVAAQPGVQAVEEATVVRADLVVLNVGVRTSIAARTIARAREANPQVRVLATVPNLEPETLRAANLLGAQAVAVTPSRPEEMLVRVRTLLEKRPAVY